jgi:hypothetical protein
MKTKNVLLSFVTLLTMVNFVSAQKVKWTANAQDTRDTTKPLIYFGPAEWGGWLTSASVQPGLVSYPGCDATCVALHNKVGAEFSYLKNLTLMTVSNRITHYYTNGPLTPAAFTASGAWSKFLASLDTVTIDFQGNTIWATCTDKDLTAGTVSGGWIEHPKMGRATCVISRHGNDKNFIHGLAVCGQVVDSTTSKMLLTGEAVIVTYGPVGPGPGPGGNGNNNGNGGNYAGLTFEQILQLVKAAQATNVIIAGNNNGNNNGVSGLNVGKTGVGDGGTSPGVVKPNPAPGFDPVWEPLNPQPNNTRTTTTTSTTNTTNTSPGGGGGTALQKQGQINNQLEAQELKVLKTQRNLMIAGFVFDRLKDGYDVVTDVYGPQGRWHKPMVDGGTYNFFNTTTADNTTVDANGNPIDWSNGGGAGNCPTGTYWDGTQCVY